jgi:hypothetical protein
MSESQSIQLAGTTQRVAALREDCLIRDHHRCVISRKFDYAEARKRVGREGNDKAKDEDGHFLKDEAGTFAPLEVAHIIPHSLMNVSSGKTEVVCNPQSHFICLFPSLLTRPSSLFCDHLRSSNACSQLFPSQLTE